MNSKCLLCDRRFRRVKLDFGAAGFVGVQDAEGRRINMDGNEILLAYVRVSQLVNVGNVRAGEGARLLFTNCLVTQASFFIKFESGLPKHA